jgi:hypothetical protein
MGKNKDKAAKLLKFHKPRLIEAIVTCMARINLLETSEQGQGLAGQAGHKTREARGHGHGRGAKGKDQGGEDDVTRLLVQPSGAGPRTSIRRAGPDLGTGPGPALHRPDCSLRTKRSRYYWKLSSGCNSDRVQKHHQNTSSTLVEARRTGKNFTPYDMECRRDSVQRKGTGFAQSSQ